jgi:ribosomal protein S18 acetylase RimI-like enzyme
MNKSVRAPDAEKPIARGVWVVRKANSGDLPGLVNLYRDWLRAASSVAIDQRSNDGLDLHRYLGALIGGDRSAVFVADGPDGLSGFLEVSEAGGRRADSVSRIGRLVRRVLGKNREFPFQARRAGFIDTIYVAEHARSAYLAFHLLKAGNEWFRQRGLVEIETVVYSANEDVMRLLGRYGFKPSRVIMRKA